MNSKFPDTMQAAYGSSSKNSLFFNNLSMAIKLSFFPAVFLIGMYMFWSMVMFSWKQGVYPKVLGHICALTFVCLQHWSRRHIDLNHRDGDMCFAQVSQLSHNVVNGLMIFLGEGMEDCELSYPTMQQSSINAWPNLWTIYMDNEKHKRLLLICLFYW